MALRRRLFVGFVALLELVLITAYPVYKVWRATVSDSRCAAAWAGAFSLVCCMAAFFVYRKLRVLIRPCVWVLTLFFGCTHTLAWIFLLVDVTGLRWEFKWILRFWLTVCAYGFSSGFTVWRKDHGQLNCMHCDPSSPRGNLVKIAVVADLHLGVRTRWWAETVVREIKRGAPDLVLIPGDLVDIGCTADMVRPFADLTVPVYMSLGNHEFLLGKQKALDIIRAGAPNIHLLLDTQTIITVNGEHLQLIGVDDRKNTEVVIQSLKSILQRTAALPDHMCSILLCHRPKGFPSIAATKRVDIVVSGHTHAGQLVPFFLFAKMIYRHLLGVWLENDCWHVVCPGTGTGVPVFRLAYRNTVDLFSIKPHHFVGTF
ncbi:3',5'-cyclic adenosine monophosphate phosphodiesterase CpdA [Pelomyxa schiedti]|nr:3',5'-cyclic adenosine monophosphate phosphodiesterase CpdA [Pelomyxa schiedti]